MIPDFDKHGNLPPGVHWATLVEIEDRFAYNYTRKRLFKALKKVVVMFQNCKCKELYLNGSFITNKQDPNDYDLCWEPMSIQVTNELKDFLVDQEKRKEIYHGDIFPRFPQPPFHLDHFVEWQIDRDGNAKGIISVMVNDND